jgi:hypothetical protein
MFEDLNWRWAARRAAVVIVIYLALVYVLSRVSPETFGLQSSQEVIALLVQAFFFFLIFTAVYAFVERSRNRRLAGTGKQSKPGKPSGEDSEAEAGSLKGRPNPNTSRKKARRRR